VTLFKYEVTEKDGRVLIGAMDAVSEAEVRTRLTAKGYRVNAVFSTAPVSPTPTKTVPRPQAVPTSRVSAPPNELAVFFRGLASYLHSGVVLHQALVQIGAQTRHHGMGVICKRLAERAQAGERLGEAMAEFPRAFPPNVIGLVAAGELAGFLPVIVGDLALNYEFEIRASNRWSRWTAISLWINAVGSLLVAPFVPLMYSVAATVNSEDPMDYLRAGGIAWLHYITIYMLPPLTIMFGVYFAAKYILNQPKMRPKRDALILRMPLGIGRFARMRSLASFSRILWRLQQAGILPIQAWDAASRAADNQVISYRLYQQVDAIRSGKRFSEALTATGMFTSDDQRVMVMGESSGQVVDTLERMAAYYEDAALSAAGRTKWIMTRIAIYVNILVLGYAFHCIAGPTTINPFDWVDKFMKAD